MIDDSALFHYAPGYDPAKAREYYLRTRQLTGRRRARVNPDTPTRAPQPAKSPEQIRREQLEAQKAALTARIDRLREVLAQKIEAAKARSGIEVKSDPSDSPEDKATRNESAKKSTPLTAAEKADKAKKAREEYQKENGGPSLSAEVQQLQQQVQEILKQIRAAVAEARQPSSGPQNQTASNGR